MFLLNLSPRTFFISRIFILVSSEGETSTLCCGLFLYFFNKIASVQTRNEVVYRSIFEIAAELQRLHEGGKREKLTRDDLSGGTFALSNVGTVIFFRRCII